MNCEPFLFGSAYDNGQLPTESSEFWDLNLENPPDSDESWDSISIFRHIIRLRMLQSKIHRIVFRVDIDPATLSPTQRTRVDTKVASIRSDLDQWAENIPTPPASSKDASNADEANRSYLETREYFTLYVFPHLVLVK
jgi:hypothetical protein